MKYYVEDGANLQGPYTTPEEAIEEATWLVDSDDYYTDEENSIRVLGEEFPDSYIFIADVYRDGIVY